MQRLLRLKVLLVFALIGCAGARGSDPVPALTSAPLVKIINGKWFDGSTFRERTEYMSQGVFIDRPRTEPDSVIDLYGRYVVPPFGEAHNHNFDASNPQAAKALVQKYQNEGVLYGQNPAHTLRAREGLNGFVNVPAGIDVAFSNAVLTGPGGHPIGLYLRNLGRGVMQPSDTNSAAGFMWIIRSEADFRAKWPAILSSNPDFVKVILAYSDQYEKRLADSTTVNWRGIDPRLLPVIVSSAHAAGRRVMAHVETAADFRNAVAAGVDMIGHMPGFRGDENTQLHDLTPFLIADADAERAGRQGTVVVTTLAGIAGVPDSIVRRRADSLAVRNLRTLKAHNVRIAIGSDSFRETSVPEALYLSTLGVYSNAELLEIWAEATPKAILPKRRIGRLAIGYESSFLVLDRNPLEDFSRVKNISLRVKQGFVLR